MNKKSVFHKNQVEKRVALSPTTEYIVQRGDTLYRIASMYNITVAELMSANNLTSTMIYPNQTIVIPRGGGSGGVVFEEYVVMPNDTVESISRELEVDPNTLMRYNDFTKLMLKENQIIRFPKAFAQYQVTESDTLDSILGNRSMSLEQLVDANKHNWLKAGSKINLG